MTNYIPKDKLEPFMWKEGEELPSQETPQPEVSGSSLIDSEYILMDRADTYAKGVHALRKAAVSDFNSIKPFSKNDRVGFICSEL